ncbi:hypothetical protein BraRD5C2_75900 [Bradyrhizobium sp. RD5-C2]|nr:hypothetical protein BraRD5C2_75900 [Bradyrhizobium sp. RD5-C2]
MDDMAGLTDRSRNRLKLGAGMPGAMDENIGRHVVPPCVVCEIGRRAPERPGISAELKQFLMDIDPGPRNALGCNRTGLGSE